MKNGLFYLEVFELSENLLGKEHPYTFTSMDNLTVLYYNQGRYSEVFPVLKVVLEGEEQHLRKNLYGSESTLQSFFGTISSSTNSILSLFFDTEDITKDFLKLSFETSIRRKGRLLEVQSNTLSSIQRNLDEEGLQIFDKLKQLREQESHLIQNPPESNFEQHKKELQSLSKQISDLEMK